MQTKPSSIRGRAAGYQRRSLTAFCKVKGLPCPSHHCICFVQGLAQKILATKTIHVQKKLGRTNFPLLEHLFAKYSATKLGSR